MRYDLWNIAVLTGCVLVLSGATCQKERTWDDPGPKATFRQYLMHWFHGESQKAFQMIAPDDREQLTAPLDVLRERLADEALPKKHEMLIAGRVDNPYDIKSMTASPSIDARPEPGTQVTLELEYHDQRTGRAEVVWREGRWYVDLPLESGQTSNDSPHPSAPSTSSDAGSSGNATAPTKSDVGSDAR